VEPALFAGYLSNLTSLSKGFKISLYNTSFKLSAERIIIKSNSGDVDKLGELLETSLGLLKRDSLLKILVN